MKNFFLFVLFSFFFSNNVICGEKIAFIDMDKAVSTSISGLSMLKQLNNINNTPDIISGINYYLEFCKKQQDGLFYLLIIKILRLLPKFLKNSIKKFLKNSSYKIKKKPLLSESAELFELAGVKVDFVELKIIEKYICSFYKKN